MKMSVSRISSQQVRLFLACWIIGGAFAQQHNNAAGSSRPLRQSYACEGQLLKINCNNPSEQHQNQRIRVVRANYGRFSLTVCNPNGEPTWSTKCMSHTSLQVLTERCSDKADCTVEVADKTFGDDPCPLTDKYLEVHYECTSDSVVTTPEPVPTVPPTVAPVTRVFTVAMTQTTRTTSSSTAPSTSPPPAPSVATSTLPDSTETEPAGPADRGSVGVTPVKSQQRVAPPPSDFSTEFCPQVVELGIAWPRTPKQATAFEPCPREAKGYAEWSCDDSSPPKWKGSPDLSLCTSPWMDQIRRSAAGQTSVARVAEEFARGTARNTFFSAGDMSDAVDFMKTLVERGDGLMAASGRMTDGAPSNADVQKIGESVLKAGSNLLEPKQHPSWANLTGSLLAKTATSLIMSMESTAFMLAENVPIGTILTSNDHNIVMGAGRLQTKQLAQSYKLPPDSAGKSSIELPAVTLKEHSRDDEIKVVFLAYKNIGQFMTAVGATGGDLQTYTVNSKVVTVALNGAKEKTVSLTEPVIITLEHLERTDGRDSVCAYWDYGSNKDNEFVGRWSTKGCSVLSSNDSRTVCACSHLTNFAVLLDVSGTIATSAHNDFLTKITYIGCSISIVCLVLTLIVFCSFRSLQSERTTIHKNLAFCLLIAEIFFLAGISQTQLPVGCRIFSALMHYFFLATFMWSLFEGVNLWLMLVDVFEPEKSRRVWYYLFGYGVPLVIVGTCLAVDWRSYATEAYCWLRSDNYFILSFVIPVALVVLANLFFLSVAMYYMCRSVGLQSALHARDANTWKQLKMWISGAFALVFVMSITWIFGFMFVGGKDGTVIFAYVFTFLNSFQGLFIFVLVCLRNDKVKSTLRQFIANQAQRLSDNFCGRSPSTYSDGSSPTSGGHSHAGPGFYQCAPPLDKEQAYITNYPTYWHATHRPDMSRRSTVTSTLPPNSPAPLPQCTCEHDFPEKGSSRSSNRDSGHESASCPSAESPPMQPLNQHLHQRTLYPPSVARKHASQVLQVEYPATAARLAARNARYLYGERPLYCGDEHIYAEIEQQQLEEEAQCPYSDASDESNTSATYQRTGSDASTDIDDRCPRPIGVVLDEEGRRVAVYHPSMCSIGSGEHKPLINSLGRPFDHQRHCEVRSAFRALSHNTNPHSHHHAKCRGPATGGGGRLPQQTFLIQNSLADVAQPYANGAAAVLSNGVQTEVACVAAGGQGNYNAFGLTGRRDGSKMVRRIPMMPKTQNADQPLAYSEC